MPVLDTDILTIVQRQTQPAYTRLVQRLSGLVNPVIWVTVVSFEEQMRGWIEYVKRAKPDQLITAYAKLSDLNDDFSTRPVLPFDLSALTTYKRLLSQNLRIAARDLRIAAITLANDELLISRNLRDFRKVPGLRVEDWTV